jgi:hypothetical protein
MSKDVGKKRRSRRGGAVRRAHSASAKDTIRKRIQPSVIERVRNNLSAAEARWENEGGAIGRRSEGRKTK